MLRLALCTFAILLLCLSASEVSADKVSNLSKKLERSRSSKVRISAALCLAKLDDARAIRALSRSLRKDGSADIRRISAASLGQRLSKLSGKTRAETMVALRHAAAKDRDKNVRASAVVALSKATHAQDADDSDRPTRGILVDVGTPSGSGKRLPSKTAALLQNTVKQVIHDKAPKSVRAAQGTGMPSSQQLRRKGLAGYSIVPEISRLTFIRQGSHVLVRCEVRMRLSPWAAEGQKLVTEKSATVTGAGSVTSARSRSAIANSSKACLTAVATQVTANQVLPFLIGDHLSGHVFRPVLWKADEV